MFLSFSIQYLGDEDSGGRWGLKKNWGRHWRLIALKIGDDTGDLMAGDLRQHWRLSSWKVGDNAGDLAAGRLGTTLVTKRPEQWEQRDRLSGWEAGDDAGDL